MKYEVKFSFLDKHYPKCLQLINSPIYNIEIEDNGETSYMYEGYSIEPSQAVFEYRMLRKAIDTLLETCPELEKDLKNPIYEDPLLLSIHTIDSDDHVLIK